MLKLNGKYINAFGTIVTITSVSTGAPKLDESFHLYYGDNGGVFDKNGAVLNYLNAKFSLKEYKEETQIDRIEKLLERLILTVEKFNDDYHCQVNRQC